MRREIERHGNGQLLPCHIGPLERTERHLGAVLGKNPLLRTAHTRQGIVSCAGEWGRRRCLDPRPALKRAITGPKPSSIMAPESAETTCLWDKAALKNVRTAKTMTAVHLLVFVMGNPSLSTVLGF